MRRQPPDHAPPPGRLNDRQKLFVEEYFRSNHATAAAALAGYSWPGKQGSRLASTPAVRAALDALLDQSRLRRDRERKRRAKAFLEPPHPLPGGRRRRRPNRGHPPR
jgi:Terminase small subunit